MVNDADLHNVLDIFGYTSDKIVLAIEILQGRVDIKTIRFEKYPVDRKFYSYDGPYEALTDDQILEAAEHEAMEQLRHEMRIINKTEGA